MSTPAFTLPPSRTDERLRFIDLTFDCIKQAERELIAAGEISATKPFGAELPTPRGVRINALAKKLRLEAMEREGLPMELLPPAERPVSMGEAA